MSRCNGEKRLYVETRLGNWDDIFKLYIRFLKRHNYHQANLCRSKWHKDDAN